MQTATTEDVEKLIRHHVWASAGVGLVPVPVVDMVALTAIQLNMVRKIAKAYNIPFIKDKVKNILGALVGSVVPSTAGMPLAASVTKSIPVIGQAAGALTMPVVAGACTYAVAKVFVQHFASGGTFLTFDPEKVKDYYTEMFKEGEGIARSAGAIQEAARVGSNIMEDTKMKPGKNRVTFLSEGDKIVGDLYVPETYKPGDKLPVILISPTASGVKEQTAGIYAKKLSENGLAALAFDHRHWGESEGTPRLLEDPFRKSDDISNAISFLSMLDMTDPARIGSLGICAGAGYSIFTAVTDRRIRAVGVVSGVFDQQGALFGHGKEKLVGPGKDAFRDLLNVIGQARQKYFETGEPQHVPVIPDVTKDTHAFWREAYNYFRTERGACDNWKNEYNILSFAKLASFSAMNVVQLLAPTPLLVIVGTKSPIMPSSQALFHKAGDPKEILRVKGAVHQDLFDIKEHVNPAVERLAEFYSAKLGV